MEGIDSIHQFWFGDGVAEDDYKHNGKLWFRPGPKIDQEIKDRFEGLLKQASKGELEKWKESPRGMVAFVILVDQFPRSMYRGSAEMFAYDALAIEAAKQAVDSGLDLKCAPAERLFLYFPFEHIEDLDIVSRSVELMEGLRDSSPEPQRARFDKMVTVAAQHRDIVARFGRYPHRNDLLGRETTVEEKVFQKHTRHGFMLSVNKNSAAFDKPKPEPADKDVSQSQKKMVKKKVKKAHKHGHKASFPEPSSRVLVLHSFRQNARIMRARTPKLRSEALSIGVELVYANAPIPYEPEREVLEATLMAFGDTLDTQHQRCWWNASEGNEVYQGLDISMAYLEHMFKTAGPFDGIIGFSQGGALAGLLAAMQPIGSISFKFAINISGFISRSKQHESLLLPRSIDMPSLHVYGTNDILVDQERTKRLAECFKDPIVLSHTGGHFTPNRWPTPNIKAFMQEHASPPAPPVEKKPIEVGPPLPGFSDKLRATVEANGPYEGDAPVPVGLSLEGRRLADDPFWATRKSMEFSAVREYVSGTLAAAADKEAVADDILLLAWVHEGDMAKKVKSERFGKVLLAVYLAQPRVFDNLTSAPVPSKWSDVHALATAAGLARRGADEGTVEVLVALHQKLVQLFAQQLMADAACIDGDAGDGINLNDRRWPSNCAFGAPRLRGAADKACHFAKDIAQVLFPLHAPLTNVAPGEDPLGFTKGICYDRYRRTLGRLIATLEEATPEFSEKQYRLFKEARGSVKEWEKLLGRAPSPVVVSPVPEPVIPCTLDDLRPLLTWLRDNGSLSEETPFQKGTFVPDGRLDLCKQVVGPKGIRPLLDAMGNNTQVKRLLLGNNIVGDDGGPAIAEYIKAHPKGLTTWYIAGNEFTEKGVAPVCEALEGDTHVTALWLKRNPLLPGGMRPIARLLRNNTYLSTLDLVNVGMLDEGLATVVDALEEAAELTGLRHLYLGTNAITEVGAGRLADFLATGRSRLNSLFLSCNRIGDDGASKLAVGLKGDASLQRFSVASNRITHVGAAPLCAAVNDHPAICLLDLGFTRSTAAVGELGNRIGDEGAEAVAGLLRTCPRLRVLDLLHNGIGQVGVNHIRNALKENTTLTSLQLNQFNKVHNEVAREEISAYVERNVKLNESILPELKKVELPDHISEIYSVYRTKF